MKVLKQFLALLLVLLLASPALADIYIPPLGGGGGGGSGTVTSAGLSIPNFPFTVTGTPITVSGTLTATPAAAVGDLILGNGVNSYSRLTIGTNGQVLTSNGTTASWATPTNTGTVTSVGLALTGFPATISNSPVTTTGTLTATAQAATGDLILGSGSNTYGRLTIGANNTVLTSNGTTASWAAPATSGTVTSVAQSLTSLPFLSISGSPITSSGTLALAAAGTTGDVPYFSGSNAMSKLGIGSTGNVLTVAGGVPSWAAPATSGTVTSFSAGTLSPLFTTSVATATTTPALTFSLSNAAAHTALANTTGSSAAPSYTLTSTVVTDGLPLTTQGDVLYENSTPAPARLAAGTAGQLLRTGGASANPAWSTNVFPNTDTTGDLLYASGTNTIGGLGIGSSNQALFVSSGLPAWGTLPAAGGGTGATTVPAKGSVLAGNAGGTAYANITVGTDGQFLEADSASTNGVKWASPSGSGTVNAGTSGQMAYYASSTNAVSGNVNANISSGALTLGVANTTAGTVVLEGGTSGSVTLQTNAVAGSGITCTFPATNSNSVIPDTGASNNFLTAISSGGVISKAQPAFSNLSGNATVAQGGTGLTTLTAHNVLLGEGTSNIAFAAPGATTGVPLVSNNATTDPSFGTCSIGGGGTGLTAAPTDGQLLIGDSNDSTYHLNTITAGSGITVTNGNHTITIASTGGGSGTVTSFSAGTLSPLFTTSVATATTTPALTFSLTNAGAGTIFGNWGTSSGAPSYNAIGSTNQVPTVTAAGGIAWSGAVNSLAVNDAAAQTGNVVLAVPNIVVPASGLIQPLPYHATQIAPAAVAEYTTTTSNASDGVCIGPDGNTWYATGTTKIGKVTPAGTVTEYNTTSSTKAVCVGPDGNIWYSTTTTKVGKITTAGGSDTEYSTTTTPIAICAGPDGLIWYGTGSTKVGKITTAGASNTEYTTTSTVASFPNSICVGPDGNIWYGTTTTKIGQVTTGGTVTEFSTTTSPKNVCAGPDGNVWYGTATTKMGKISVAGAGNTEYTTTTSVGSNGICAGPDGKIWYATNTTKVGNVTTGGTDTEFNTTTAPVFIASGADGGIWYGTSTTTIGTAPLPLTTGQITLRGNTLTSTATTAARTFTLPDANSNSVVPDTGASNNFLTAISSGGVISKAQPAFSNLSGNITAAQMLALTSAHIYVGNGSNQPADVAMSGGATISNTGAVTLGNPGASTLGGIESLASASHKWINTISTSGVPAATQPDITDISGTAHGVAVFTTGAIGTTVAPGTNGNVLTSNGTDWVSSAAAGGSGTVTSVTFTGDGVVDSSTPSSAVTTSGTVTATIKTQSATTALMGPQSGNSAAAPTFRAPNYFDVFGDSSNLRAAPTTGTLTGDYYTSGNWTTTGTITCRMCRLFFGGTVTINNNITVTSTMTSGAGGASGAVADEGGPGSGMFPGGIGGGGTLNGGSGGGGNVNNGGKGGGTVFCGASGNWGGYVQHSPCLWGCGGGAGGGGDTGGAGGAGGTPGGGLYIEAVGNVDINANITANGGAGGAGSSNASGGNGGGGGSGGNIEISSQGTVTLETGKTITTNGGAGGAGNAGSNTAGGGGGGGAGGWVEMWGTTVTNNGTITQTGGAAGGSNGTAATAGGSGGNSLNSFVTGARVGM